MVGGVADAVEVVNLVAFAPLFAAVPTPAWYPTVLGRSTTDPDPRVVFPTEVGIVDTRVLRREFAVFAFPITFSGNVFTDLMGADDGGIPIPKP